MREGEKDPGLYDFRPYRDRAKLEWPEGKRVAVWVSPNLEFYEIDPPANPQRKSWPRPHPDVVGYGHRDYANRIGHWRMAEVMDLPVDDLCHHLSDNAERVFGPW